MDALECKMAAMNFMSKLQRITNEAFPSCVPVSYPIDRTSLDTYPHHLSSFRTAIESSSESPESGGISTIELGLDSSTFLRGLARFSGAESIQACRISIDKPGGTYPHTLQY